MSTEPEGLLPVDKPEGPTSHDVVARARRILGTRRIGHTGTLDPFASGLLLLLVGRATRLAEYFDDLPKRYAARMRLGVATDTDDRTGAVTARTAGAQALDTERVRAALEAQTGTRLQRPPAFSAKKVRGQRAYEAAREGKPLALEPVPVQIDEVRVTAVDLPDVAFEVTCGAGTYIRAIARDAGAALGVGAHLLELRRTGIGPFDVHSAIRLEDLDHAAPDLVPPARALAHLPRVEVGPGEARDLAQGRRVTLAGEAADAEPVAVISGDALIAVGALHGGELAPRKVFAHG